MKKPTFKQIRQLWHDVMRDEYELSRDKLNVVFNTLPMNEQQRVFTLETDFIVHEDYMPFVLWARSVVPDAFENIWDLPPLPRPPKARPSAKRRLPRGVKRELGETYDKPELKVSCLNQIGPAWLPDFASFFPHGAHYEISTGGWQPQTESVGWLKDVEPTLNTMENKCVVQVHVWIAVRTASTDNSIEANSRRGKVVLEVMLQTPASDWPTHRFIDEFDPALAFAKFPAWLYSQTKREEDLLAKMAQQTIHLTCRRADKRWMFILETVDANGEDHRFVLKVR